MKDVSSNNYKKADLLIIIPFLLITAYFFIASFLYPDHERSETENRMLAQAPVLSRDEFMNFPRDYEKYYNDQFPYRESFLRMYSRLELSLNKISVRNLYVVNGFLLPQEYLYPQSQIDISAQNTNKLMKYVKSTGKEGAYIALPYKTSVYNYMLPPFLQNNYGEQNFDHFVKKLDPGTNVCDAFRCYEGQSRSELEKYFFKTDLHWNYRGAEAAFKYIVKWLANKHLIDGFDPDTVSFENGLIENAQYLGDLNRRYSFLFPTNEEIPVFGEDNGSVKYYLSYYDDIYTQDKSEIASTPEEEGTEMYNSVYSNNLSYYKMVNDRAISDEHVLVIKDSMQNAMTDLFAQVFNTTEVIDIRYLQEASLEELIGHSEAGLVLLMYHQDNVTGEMFNFGIE